MKKPKREVHPLAKIFRESFPKQIDCPVCYKTTRTIARTRCGHHFCRWCIGEWLVKHNTCPICRGNLIKKNGTSLAPDRAKYLRRLFLLEWDSSDSEFICGLPKLPILMRIGYDFEKQYMPCRGQLIAAISQPLIQIQIRNWIHRPQIFDLNCTPTWFLGCI